MLNLELITYRTKRKSFFSATYLRAVKHAVAFSVSCRLCIMGMGVQYSLCTLNGSKEW